MRKGLVLVIIMAFVSVLGFSQERRGPGRRPPSGGSREDNSGSYYNDNSSSSSGSTTSSSEDLDMEEIEELIFELVNEEREDEGLQGFDYSDEMAELAEYHSQNMVDYDFFDHTDHQGNGMSGRWDIVCPDVSWSSIAENIAMNYGDTEEEVAENFVESWMDSPGHRANILSDNEYIGVGVVGDGTGYYYATQCFYTAAWW